MKSYMYMPKCMHRKTLRRDYNIFLKELPISRTLWVLRNYTEWKKRNMKVHTVEIYIKFYNN